MDMSPYMKFDDLQAFEMNSLVQKLPMKSHFGNQFFFDMLEISIKIKASKAHDAYPHFYACWLICVKQTSLAFGRGLSFHY